MSVHKRVWKRADGSTGTAYQVKYSEGKRQRSKTFRFKKDADRFDAEATRLRQLGLGSLADLNAGTQTLDEYVANTWLKIYAPKPEKTLRGYASLDDHHIAPTFGHVPLRLITSEMIQRWQADRLAAGGGPVAVHKAVTLLGGVLECAADGGHIPHNPQRRVRRAKLPKKREVRPLAPVTVEAMRAAASPRDAMLLSVLAYSGLRPGEALALRWGDIVSERSWSSVQLRSARTAQARHAGAAPCGCSRHSRATCASTRCAADDRATRS